MERKNCNAKLGRYRSLSILFFIFFNVSVVTAQVQDSVLNNNMQIWNRHAAHRKPGLYLQSDKLLYHVNENLLFTAFLYDRGSDTAKQNILHILLVDLAQKKVAASDRFVLDKGISSGSLLIPESAETGEYLIVAYTNGMLNESPELFFRQEVTVKAQSKPPFLLNVTVPDHAPADSLIHLHCKITTDYGGLASGGQLTYSLEADGKLLRSGKKIIDAFGEVEVDIPARDTISESFILYSTVKRDSLTVHCWSPIAIKPRKISVRYYPESGMLLDGTTAKMGIEVRKSNGAALSTRGVVYADGRELAHFHTDEYGLGTVTYAVSKKARYTVKLLDIPAGYYSEGAFPEIHESGIAIDLVKGVVRDSLAIGIRKKMPDSNFSIIIYSNQSLLYAGKIQLRETEGRFAIPAPGWPRGIARIILFADDGSPLAERAVFIPGAPLKVLMLSDSSVYHQRSKVQLNIRINDGLGNPVVGLFSFASALAGRVGGKNNDDIVSDMDFERNLAPGHDPLPPSGYFDSDSAIDNVLLTSFGGSHWKMVVGDISTGGAPLPSVEDYGYILHNRKKIKRPVKLLLMGRPTNIFGSDSSGQFALPAEVLTQPFGMDPAISVMDQADQDDYGIVLSNHYDSLNIQIASSWYYPQRITKDTSVIDEDENNGAFNSIRTLKKVVVKARNKNEDDDVYNFGAKVGWCPDWVCSFGYLNCPAHHSMQKPKIGEVYLYYPDASTVGGMFKGQKSYIVYSHCMSCKACSPVDSAEHITTVPGIHLTKIFYDMDSLQFPSSSSALLSTLYWAPAILTDKNGEAKITFYTGDLIGRFYNIIEGITAEGALTGREIFRVIQ